MRTSSVRFRASQANTEFEGVLSSRIARMKQGTLVVSAGECKRDCRWRIYSLGPVEAETARPDFAVRTSAFYPLPFRSEEQTSELQSLRHLVCRLLLEKKNIIYMYLFF